MLLHYNISVCTELNKTDKKGLSTVKIRNQFSLPSWPDCTLKLINTTAYFVQHILYHLQHILYHHTKLKYNKYRSSCCSPDFFYVNPQPAIYFLTRLSISVTWDSKTLCCSRYNRAIWYLLSGGTHLISLSSFTYKVNYFKIIFHLIFSEVLSIFCCQCSW